jgi:low affinity Fe/Cu permease
MTAPHAVRRTLTEVGVATSRPVAFVIVGVYVVLWIVFERDTLDWHGVATVFTWLMTLFIQRAEHRDTQAIQAKLDEIIGAVGGARNEVAHLDEEEPEEIEAHRGANA